MFQDDGRESSIRQHVLQQDEVVVVELPLKAVEVAPKSGLVAPSHAEDHAVNDASIHRYLAELVVRHE